MLSLPRRQRSAPEPLEAAPLGAEGLPDGYLARLMPNASFGAEPFGRIGRSVALARGHPTAADQPTAFALGPIGNCCGFRFAPVQRVHAAEACGRRRGSLPIRPAAKGTRNPCLWTAEEGVASGGAVHSRPCAARSPPRHRSYWGGADCDTHCTTLDCPSGLRRPMPALGRVAGSSPPPGRTWTPR